MHKLYIARYLFLPLRLLLHIMLLHGDNSFEANASGVCVLSKAKPAARCCVAASRFSAGGDGGGGGGTQRR